MSFDSSHRAERSGAAPALRVLIVRTGAMGDVLHGLPAVSALRQLEPHCFIGWAIEPHWKPLLAACDPAPDGYVTPLVDEVHEVPTRAWKRRPFSWSTLRAIRALRRQLVAKRYDICVDLQGSLRSAIIGRLSGARRLIGNDSPRERVARVFYDEQVQTSAQHVIEQACTLIAAAIHRAAIVPTRPRLPLDANAEQWVESRLHLLGLKKGERFVLLVPGAGWGAKRWPLERFRTLAQLLHAAGYRVLVNGVARDVASEATFSFAWGDDAIVIETAVAQLIALTRHACLVVGGDTGPVHLAAALGIPVVAVFGPTDPARNGPAFPGARVHVLRHPGSTTDHQRQRETEYGLRRITVDEVFSAAMSLLEASQERLDGKEIR